MTTVHSNLERIVLVALTDMNSGRPQGVLCTSLVESLVDMPFGYTTSHIEDALVSLIAGGKVRRL